MIIRDGKFIIYYESEGRVVKGSSLATSDIEFMREMEGYGEVDVYPNTKYLIPCCDGFFIEPDIDIPKFYEMFELEGFADVLREILPEGHQDKADLLVNIAMTIRNRQYVTDDINKYVYKSPLANRLYKEQQPPKGFTLPFNKTLKQRSPSDKLFVKLPDELALKNLEAGNPAIYPAISEVYTPYPTLIYNTPFIEPIILSSGKERTDLIASTIAALKEFHIGCESVQKELAKIENANIPVEYVIGDDYNDDLDIQENEQEFFDSVNSWVTHYTKQHIKQTNAGKSEEELNELTQLFLERGRMPKHVLDFFDTLIQEAIRYSYSHSPEVLLDIDLVSDDEQHDSLPDSVSLMPRKNPNGYTGEMTTIQYVSYQASQYGYRVWIEALIKLFRWGERKPRNLIVPNDSPNSLDLKTFQMNTKATDIASMEKVQLPSGKYATVFGIAPGQVFANGEMREMFTILMLKTDHRVPNTGETISYYQHIYLGDVVEAYLDGDEFIDGISLVNGVFEINDNTIDETDDLDGGMLSGFKPYLTSKMIRLATEKGFNGLITSSTMLAEPKKSYMYLKQYMDIEKEMAIGSAEIKSQIWYGSRISKDIANATLFTEDFSRYMLSDMLDYFLHIRQAENKPIVAVAEVKQDTSNTKSSVFQKGAVTGMSAIVFKGDKNSLTWQKLMSNKEDKNNIDPVTKKPVVLSKHIGYIHVNSEARTMVVASLQDGVTETPGTSLIKLVQVYQWMVDALLVANNVPTTQEQRLQALSETSITNIMSIRLI